jgi:hypothetical protein
VEESKPPDNRITAFISKSAMGRTRSRENRGELDQLPIPSQITFKKWENQ